jgi:imidazole glycerol-phosphate synthase subunit HisH
MTMTNKIVIVDYGLGNLLSVVRAFNFVGIEAVISDLPTDFESATHLVLPGVGAFSIGMQGLAQRKLIDPIKKFAASGRPTLGICLGMQMLFEESEEFGHHQGLGLIPGKVVAVPQLGSDGKPHKIPHIGWNELCLPQGQALQSWQQSILKEVHPGQSAYFVHSYAAMPLLESDRLADVQYDGVVISAAVRHNNVYGCQFHPEKSGPVGLSIVKAFSELQGDL